MKTKVLGLVHGEYLSHTVRVLEIAKALRRAGKFEILFSGNGPYMKKIEKAGFEWVHTKTISEQEITGPSGALENKIAPVLFNKDNIEELFQEEDKLLREYKPDIIIRDLFRELAGIAAKQYKIYDVFLQQANVCPYYHVDFKPRNTPWYMRLSPGEKSRFPIILRFGEWYIRKKTFRYLHCKTKQLRLKLEKKSNEGAEANLILIPDSKILFPFSNIKSKYKYTGPVLVLNQAEKPSWAEKFISDQRKKIITSSGSTGRHDRIDLFFEAFKDGKYAVAVHHNSKKFQIPEGFYGGNFEVSSIIKYADVFITHGGLGSTYLGLMNAIPMIALYSHFEQQINASQLKKTGAGISLNPKEISPQKLRNKTEEIINNPLFKNKAIDISKQLNEELSKNKPLELAVNYIMRGYEKFKNSKT